MLAKDIESGRTIVIPVRLDNSQMPPLLLGRRYVDLRRGLISETIEELACQLVAARSGTRVRRLIPERRMGPDAAILTMIVSGLLTSLPVASLCNVGLLEGTSLLELYRAIEILIIRYQDLCDEILASSPWDEQSVRRTNRRLATVASDMRALATSLDRLIQPDDALRRRLTDVLEVCVSISTVEDLVVIKYGNPHELSMVVYDDWGLEREEIAGLPLQ